MTTEHHFPRAARVVHNLIILDESGSMESIKDATISGFNELVQSIRAIEKCYSSQRHYVSLYTFNSLGVKQKIFAKSTKTLKKLTETDFQPNAMTPLYDAVGTAVNDLRRYVEKENARENGGRFPEFEDEYDENVLVTIFTDGEENDSTEYTKPAVRSLVDRMTLRGWQFTYIGTNHDVHAAAADLGVDNILKCVASYSGVTGAFDKDKEDKMRFAASLENDKDR